MSTEMVERDAQAISYENPFVGLRPFDFEECHLYFGRDGQVEKLLVKLKSVHFVAVVGVSGSGKSSLVRAGLLPALLGGFMRGAGSDWKIALLRPGDRPIGRLAEALIHLNAYGSGDEENDDLRRAVTEATLLRGSLGLIDVVRHANRPSGENLLVVVDQFEEIFRYADTSRAAKSMDDGSLNEAAAFVKLLLEAARQRELPIYVMLTMRSDFLGNCAQFWDLPEAINDGQYLIPRMTYDERREAITGPVAVGGAEMTQRLVNQLLADLGEDPAQLPVLQHALMRTWDEWREKRVAGHPEKHEGKRIDLCCYEAIGGLKKALSLHAEEAYREASELFGGEGARITEALFKSLTELDESNRATRRPTKLQDISLLIGASEAEIQEVIEIFRRPDRSFLTPRAGEPIKSNTIVDISHECLIGNWARLRDWVNDEARDIRSYRDIANDIVRYIETSKNDKSYLYAGTKLQQAQKLLHRNKLTSAWGQRYYKDIDSEEVVAFLTESQKKGHRTMWLRRAVITGFIIAGVVSAILALVAYRQQRISNQAEIEARIQRKLADNSAAEATAQRDIANEQAEIAKGALIVAEASKSVALKESEKSLKNAEIASQAAKEALAEKQRAENLLYLSHIKGAYDNQFIDTIRSQGLLDEAQNTGTHRRFEWFYLWNVLPKVLGTLKSHTRQVKSVAFSPDGKTLALGSDDGAVKLWEASSGKEPATLRGHTDNVNSVGFSRDGKTLASGSDDGTVKLWEVSSRKELATLKGHTLRVKSLAFSPDGRTLASGSADKTVKLWEVSSGKELATLEGHTNNVNSVEFSPDGKTLASGSDDGTVKLWEVSSGKEVAILEGHNRYVNSVAFSPDGKTLASGSSDQTVKLWEVSSGNVLATLRGHTFYINSVAFSPDGKTLASGSDDRTVKLWEVSSGKVLATLEGHTHNVNSVGFPRDGKTLASGSDDGTVKLWEVSSGKEVVTLRGHTSFVNSVAFSPDRRTLASGSSDQSVKLWEVSRGKVLATLEGHTHNVNSVTFSPDGRTLASGSTDKKVKLWEVSSGKLLATLEGHTHNVNSVAFSPDGKTLASGSTDKTVKLWEVSSGKEVATLKGHISYVNSVAFSPDGRTLASGSTDRTVKLWEAGSGKEMATLKGHTSFVYSVAFSPDGRTLASGSDDGTVKLWEAGSGKEMATLEGHTSYVTSVAFSLDGRTLASGSADLTVKLWEASNGKEMATLKGHTHIVKSVAFSPDGRTLSSGGFDEKVILRLAATEEDIKAFEKRRSAYLQNAPKNQ